MGLIRTSRSDITIIWISIKNTSNIRSNNNSSINNNSNHSNSSNSSRLYWVRRSRIIWTGVRWALIEWFWKPILGSILRKEVLLLVKMIIRIIVFWCIVSNRSVTLLSIISWKPKIWLLTLLMIIIARRSWTNNLTTFILSSKLYNIIDICVFTDDYIVIRDDECSKKEEKSSNQYRKSQWINKNTDDG